MLSCTVHGALNGTVSAPVSKSDLHRLIIACALSCGESLIHHYTLSQDIQATANVIGALGASVRFENDCTIVDGIFPSTESAQSEILCDCNESGSTLRFLVPVCAALGCRAVFTGHGRLSQRPMEPLCSQLAAHGVSLQLPENGDSLPLHISGKLRGGDFFFSGDISSQYITGLLFALPLLEEDSRILLTSPLQSKGYVEMTLQLLKQFGIRILPLENGWQVFGRQSYCPPKQLTAQGDWSNAAFWLCAGAISKTSASIRVTGMDMDSLQGDREVCQILQRMGAKMNIASDFIEVFPSQLHGTTIDAAQIPDIIPILSVAAAAAQGQTTIVNAGRLRIKESDRLHAICHNLTTLGAQVTEGTDSLVVCGTGSLNGGTVDSFNDHRISMSMAVASLLCEQPVTILDPMCVNKSYPDFFEQFERLGGSVRFSG